MKEVTVRERQTFHGVCDMSRDMSRIMCKTSVLHGMRARHVARHVADYASRHTNLSYFCIDDLYMNRRVSWRTINNYNKKNSPGKSEMKVLRSSA